MKYELVDLRQRHIEALGEIVGTHSDASNAHKFRRMVIETAIESGWFKEKPEGDVLDWIPGDVLEVSNLIFEAYTQAISVPPA